MPKKKKLLFKKIGSLLVSLVVLVGLLVAVAAYQDVVSFEDSGLEEAIWDELGIEDELIIRSDLLQITHLDASGYGIDSLEGIEFLSRLEVLDLEDNYIKDVTPLSELSRLTELNLRNNEITCLEEINFKALSGLPLRFLSLRHNVSRPENGNQVRLSDISVLSEFRNLEELGLRDNHIEDLTPLQELNQLKVLDLRENRFNDLYPLANLSELTELNIRYNAVSDLAPLEDLTNLTYLNIHSNHDIQSIEPLSNLTKLQTLIMSNVPVGYDLSALEALVDLQRLNVRYTGLSDPGTLIALMEQGVLQDRPEDGISADIDIRENPVLKRDYKIFDPLRDYWSNINRRLPYTLPLIEPEKLFEIEAAGAIPRLNINMQESDLNELYTRDRRSNERLPAIVSFEQNSPVKYFTELRFRGNTLRAMEKKSFNIRFEGGHDLFFGSNYMNANSMYADPSMMREYLAFEMFNHLDLPASRTSYFELWINDVYEGLYLHIERVDEKFLEARGFNPKGMLVRDQFRSYRSKYELDRSSAMGFELSNFDAKNRSDFISEVFISREHEDWYELVDLILWVEHAEPGQEFAIELENRFNVELLLDFLIIHFLIGDIDSFADDYWLYLDHSDPHGKWKLVPWDKDLSFGSHWRSGYGVANNYFHYQYIIGQGWGNKLIDLILNTDNIRSRLDNRMSYLMTNEFKQEFFLKKIEDVWSGIKQSIEYGLENKDTFMLHNMNNHNPGTEALYKEQILDFVGLRYAFLDRHINPVDGEPYRAELYLSEYSEGAVMLTDAEGWTVARLELLKKQQVPDLIAVEVTEEPGLDGINRIWQFNNYGSEIETELTLFYRNEAEESFTRENWVTGSTGPVGDQWDLVMAEIEGGSADIIEDSRVNPFSNKVEATTTIKPGKSEFVIIYE